MAERQRAVAVGAVGDVDARHQARRGRARADQRAVGDAGRVEGGGDAWRALNRRFKTEIGGARAPDANEEYLIYQTLVGAWPFDDGDADARARSASASSPT